MRSSHFLITGCGHQGTGWMARAMNLLGHPTGHEWVYNFQDEHRWANLAGDSAWPAAPLIPFIDGQLTVLHLTRHPMEVVASIYSSNFLRSNCACGHPPETHRDDPYVQYVLKWFPDIWDISPDESRCVAWVCMWNRLVEANSKGRPYLRSKIEDVSSDPSLLAEVAAFLTGVVPDDELVVEVQGMVPKDLNTHRHAGGNPLTFDSLPQGYWKGQLAMLIRDYGYEVP